MSTSQRLKPTALQRIAIFFIAHVLISAALITAVGSLLFYLIDIRATVLTGGNDLKRIGGWFVVATVDRKSGGAGKGAGFGGGGAV